MPRINGESDRLTLASAPTERCLTVLRISTAPALARRLGALGLRPGVPVRILHRVSGGGRAIGVAGAKLVLDRSILRAIDVEQVDG